MVLKLAPKENITVRFSSFRERDEAGQSSWMIEAKAWIPAVGASNPRVERVPDRLSFNKLFRKRRHLTILI
jgi:hypothetical protein